MALTLILGGARSGKSDFALQLARASGRTVVFVATMEARDEETRRRIDAHRRSRPAAWQTLEEPIALLDALAANVDAGACVVVDCLTLWVSNLLLAALPAEGEAPYAEREAAISATVAQARALAGWCAGLDGEALVVSNEVGSGVVPAYALGRDFRDALGAANREVAAQAERVYHLVAGVAVDVKALGGITISPGATSDR
jgi:adenosyl cobinamide kinase/adenosyl cobinamide phosphate guanylyltransferase